MTQFSIRAVANGPQCDLVLSGDVDLEVVDAVTRVADSHLADTGVQCLLLDLGAVTFIDSTGMGALLAIRKAAEKQGKDIVLGNISERIRQLLAITGLGSAFEINSNGGSRSSSSVRTATNDGIETDVPTDTQLRITPTAGDPDPSEDKLDVGVAPEGSRRATGCSSAPPAS